MTAKRRGLFLYLAIACFVAIIAIFVADGYMGIYDTVYVTAEEHEQRIAPEYWLRLPPEYEITYSYVGAEWGEPVHFRYEIDNRQFSTYSTPIQASVWKENQKVLDLFSEDKLIEPFDKVMVGWTLDSKQLQSGGFSGGQYTVKIERKGVERKIRVGYHYPPTLPKIR
jgi:hypothetical protein